LLILALLFCSQIFASSILVYEANKKGIDLSDKDKETLEIGEISTARYVVGGVLGTYPLGLGIGHAIQGRWSQKGWIFTTGQLVSATAAVVGIVGCAGNELENGFNDKDDCSAVNETLVVAGILGYFGFRIWEIVDVWATPPSHNKKVKELQDYIEKAPTKAVKSSLYFSPIYNKQQNGTGLGLTYTF